MNKKIFWFISWYQPTQDYRPLSYPPTQAVKAWWCTGHTDKASIIVAAVEADDEQMAKAAIQKDWPEATEWRFCDELKTLVFSDRFPVQGWMKDRGCSNGKPSN